MTTLAATTTSPLRKIIFIVGAAILIFLAFTTFSVHKSVQSDAQISDIKDLYFPVLQGIEANIVRLDKMEELYMRAAMLGEHEPVEEAAKINLAADKIFAETITIYPARAAEIAKLRADFKAYNDIAANTANTFLKNRQANITAQAQRMSTMLEDLRQSISRFRESSYQSFVKNLADTQRAVKVNLYMGLALGVMNLFFMGVLVYFIRNNVKMMGIIAEQNASLERRVAERTAQLRQKTLDIQAMLQNMPQGVLTVLPGGVIHPEYSAYLETIFETQNIASRTLVDLIFSDTSLGSDSLSQVEASVSACIGEDEVNFEFNGHLLVKEFDKRFASGATKSLELSWSPICDDSGTIEKLMLCVRDVTEFKKLASEAHAQKRELEIIGEVLAVTKEKFQDFIRSAYQFIAENEAIVRETRSNDLSAVGLLFRNMHTIKGNARTYGLLHMTNTVHETEQAYETLRSDPMASWDAAALLGQLSAVHALVREYEHINDHTLGRKGPGRRGGVERFLMVDKDQIAHALALIKSIDASDMAELKSTLEKVDQTLRLIGTEKLSEVLSGPIEALPSLAAELGKDAPHVTIIDNGIAIKTQVSGLLKNVFTHLLRNSMDHGIESAAERMAAGKPGAGRIELSAAVEAGQLKLKLRDDGRGLAIGKIRQKAVHSGLLKEGDAAAPEAVAQLIFASGFSTAEAVTEVSGRGVGMDAVKGFLTREGGDVQIRFLDGDTSRALRPFELHISLPEKFAER